MPMRQTILDQNLNLNSEVVWSNCTITNSTYDKELRIILSFINRAVERVVYCRKKNLMKPADGEFQARGRHSLSEQDRDK